MDGVFALVVPVNEDIKIVPGFGRNCDKLLIAAEIVNKGRVPLRRKGCGFFGFLIDNAAVVEGNSGDACKIKSYPLDYACIKGYGLMNWN